MLKDAIPHRSVKSTLIQTCLGLVEAQASLLLSRQFVLPKLSAKGKLDETRVPRAMLENPAVTSDEEEYPASAAQSFFEAESVAGVLAREREMGEQMVQQQLLPTEVPGTSQKAAKPLIQEIESDNFSVEKNDLFRYKLIKKGLYEIYGCPLDYVEKASVSYLKATHEILLENSESFNTLRISLISNDIPKRVRSEFSKVSGTIRILVE